MKAERELRWLAGQGVDQSASEAVQTQNRPGNQSK